MNNTTYYKRKNPNNKKLKHGRYWDTVKLKNGSIIWVIKSRCKSYPKG